MEKAELHHPGASTAPGVLLDSQLGGAEMRFTITAVTLTLLVVNCAAAIPQIGKAVSPATVEQPILSKEMIAADARLTNRITVRLRCATVDEFLAEASRQTGVDLRASARDGTGDTLMTFVCFDTPLDRMLNGLWSCLSYKGAMYGWERSGEPAKYRYLFAQTEGSRRLRARLRDMAQKRLEHDAEILLGAVDGTDDEKREALKKITDDPDNYARNLGLTSERVWTDLRSFKEALTPDQRQAVLHGQTITAPLTTLAPISQAYYSRIHQEAQGLQTQVGAQPLPPPPFIRFNAIHYFSLPSITIDVPNCTTFMPVIGGSNAYKGWKLYLASLWELDGDAETNSRIDRRIESEPAKSRVDRAVNPFPARLPNGPANFDPETGERIDWPGRLAERWEQVGVGSHIPLICRLARDEDIYDSFPDIPIPGGLTVSEFIGKLWNKQHIVKWRDSVMLVTNTCWPNEDPPIPGSFLRRLRANAKPGCILPMTDVTEAAETLTDKQLRRLAGDYPAMQEVMQKRGLLLLLKHRPELARLTGAGDRVPLDASLRAAISESFSAADIKRLEAVMPTAFEFRMTESTEVGNASRKIHLLFRDASGKVVGLFAYDERPMPFKRSTAASP